MRPINKGNQPYGSINTYQDAVPYLTEQIGAYCSFCEMPIIHVPEVEHKESKNSGGALTNWRNLLLSCKYCNTRKAEKIRYGQHDEAIWPDENNTFMAYTYEHALPELNEEFLQRCGHEVYLKAKRLFDAVVLNNTDIKRTKDRRSIQRNEVYNTAISAYQDWEKIKRSCYKDSMLDQIIQLAKASGFFSIWMTVFQTEAEVKNQLICAFVGTKTEYFDEHGNSVVRI